MRRLRVKLAIGVATVGVVVTATAAMAGGGQGRLSTSLTGYEEVPAVSTAGEGSFKASISRGSDEIRYKLNYEDLEGGALQQAHIHFGQEAVNGGISVFLCTNLGNGPAGTQACPPPPARVSGTITPADVIGPGAQGIAAGEFDELVQAIRSGIAYVNVHTATWPGGEIRGQFDGDDDHDDD
jgi:hypothetical protein